MQTYDHKVFRLAANLLVPTVYPAFACIAIREAAKELGYDYDVGKEHSDKFFQLFHNNQRQHSGAVIWMVEDHGTEGAYEQRIWALFLMAEICKADPTLNA